MSQNKDSHAQLSQEQLMEKLTDDSTSPEELEEIMAFLAEKDSQAHQEIADMEARLKEQDSEPQLGEGLTGIHNAMDSMSKATTEYVNNQEKRDVTWNLVRAGYMPAIDEMCSIYQARRDLLFSVREDLSDIADKLVPKVELDETKDPWEEMGRFNKEVEDTEAQFRKEMESVSSFTQAYHEMPEYQELTVKLVAVKERISLMEKEFELLMGADEQDMENVAEAMKKIDEVGKKL